MLDASPARRAFRFVPHDVVNDLTGTLAEYCGGLPGVLTGRELRRGPALLDNLALELEHARR